MDIFRTHHSSRSEMPGISPTIVSTTRSQVGRHDPRRRADRLSLARAAQAIGSPAIRDEVLAMWESSVVVEA
jgi:hypothetical protein